METLIIKIPTVSATNNAIMQVLSGLSKLGAITIEKSPYNEDFVEKIAKGDCDLKAGKGVKINPTELWT